ncbi:hypothetical protein B0H16DRAFT_1548962 [Mycena metata]|uniref:Uncharacterized protein n=1 Tax=Mycena metata TaxID=1033252 RepID=A0AAD7N984_9AGAR|nr:hypothetical protein B0H16DRAFT_1571854 [Mycena metata]KAJ7751130.1 hypothetical protein B0H16DRAFT_1548962 [Mycena metata]
MHHARSKIGTIVGGTIGGVLTLGILAGAIWFRRRRQRSLPPSHPALIYEPFTGAPASPFLPSTSTPVTSLPFLRTDLGSRPPPGTKTEEQPRTPTSPQMRSPTFDAPQPEVSIRTSVLPTERLISSVNHGLQNRPWEEEEMPPSYPFTDSDSVDNST